ncbi:hypothetical protein L1285_16850 [Pseudoalteromonas sp. DL2-H2.2]|uniref:phage tail tube protein n=1 Tax=Pseudoalteromonas sp. DL2-H2.2 TaxID=2908889 RepID=UPI001F172ED3|nr:hypothetical protein [Pseudoalteromonas sp. DL2-H2.2]MCF2909991.1 hypothetical protein [Pseudoalteromonas sp. DL2-H2.2]
MQTTSNKSFQGRGSIYAEEIGASSGLLPFGNCSGLDLSTNEESQDLNDYENPGGGVLDTLSRVNQISASITSTSFSARNIAIALRGLVNTSAAVAVAAEEHTVKLDAFTPFNKIPDKSKTITVTDNAGTTTYVEGTDYKVRNSGLIALSGGTIADNSVIKVTYESMTSHNIEGITQQGKEYRIVFDGLNEADSNKPVRITLHRVRFSPADALSFISDDFSNVPLNLTVLKDGSIAGAGQSQYLKIEQAA